MLGFLASYSPSTCLTTNWESPKAERVVARRLVASRNPVIMTSYSASLFMALKVNRSACLISNSSGLIKMIPTPLLSDVEAPSTRSIQPCGVEVGLLDVVSPWGRFFFFFGKVHFVTKSASDWAFIAV